MFLKSLMRVLALLVLVAVPSVSQADVLRGDVDGNGKVSIGDVTALINYLLTGVWPDEPVIPADGHEWVDLGLPSGTLWATCNVGANAPEEYGDYFAWGETAPKDYYVWGTYKWCNGSSTTLTKYCTSSSYGYNGFVDNKTELDPEDDAAYAHYPGGRMPSLEQIQELVSSCNWQWTQRNGVNGQLGTGPNGNTIFLPAAGRRLDESLDGAGSWGGYWSRKLIPDYSDNAYCLYFHSRDMDRGIGSRFMGFAIRAVRVSQN